MFCVRRASPDGLSNKCGPCKSAYDKEYAAKNKNKIQKYQKEHYAKNKQLYSEKQKKYYNDNKERLSISHKTWREKNADKKRESDRTWREANAEAVKMRMKDYYNNNKDVFKKRAIRWAKDNPEKRRAIIQSRRSAPGTLSPDIVDRLFAEQQGVCPCCGEALFDEYHIDHIMPLALGGTNTDNNVQLLKPWCNLSKSTKHPDIWRDEILERRVHGRVHY
jgi:hypothetical protein